MNQQFNCYFVDVGVIDRSQRGGCNQAWKCRLLVWSVLQLRNRGRIWVRNELIWQTTAMAGKSAASAPELDGNRESSFLDNILRRLESSSDQEAASNSMEAFDASVLSPNSSANPWQYLSTSNPPSPTLQRDFCNLTHSLDASENPWTELEQQRVPLLQADDVSHGGARATLFQRRREQRNPANDSASDVPGAHGQSDAMLYEELAAAWYRSGYLRGPSVSPRDEGLQGTWEGLFQAYASKERWGNSSGNQNADSAPVNQQFDPNTKSFGLVDTSDEAARWQRPMPSLEVGGRFVESSTSEAADMDTRTAPSLPVGGNPIRSSSDCRVSPNTSLSSESGGDDSDDEECARNVDQLSVLDSGGKRKTPASEELEEKDESARTSTEITELKQKAPSEIPNRPRKKKNTKRSREPRYAIKTRTDVDIMDDGFKWRKYGQKAVKNSPHPRNYYRCTTPQCPVRKRVERASEDAGLVITTYEGTHTHHAPGSIPHRLASERPPHATSPLPPGLGLGLGFRSTNLLPLPPEFTTLAALHQMRSLQQILAHQQLHMPTLPRSLQRESLLRAQQFLELHDHPEVKPQPFHHNFLQNQLMGSWPGFPYRPNLQTNLMQQQHRNPPQNPQADADLVRRVLEADEFGGNVDFREENVDSSRISTPPGDFVSQIQSGLRNQVAMETRRRAALLQRAATVPRGSVTGARSRGGGTGEGLPRRPVPRPIEDELVDGLLQEMAKRGESSVSR